MHKKAESTALLLVSSAILAGLVAALHMGKVPAALPDITRSLQLSLTQAGLIVSVFSVIAAVFGLLIGIFSFRFGHVRSGVIGLAAVAAGSFLGGISASYTQLLLTRILEGLGFVLIAITMPGIINALCPPKHKSIAMGIWGAFIPAAMAIMLLITPSIILSNSWREVWFLVAIISTVWLVVFGLGFWRITFEPIILNQTIVHLKRLFSRRHLIIVCIFICYSALFAAVTAFLPTFWAEVLKVNAQNAASLTALVVSANIVGNIFAGFATGRAVSMDKLLIAAFIFGGSCAVILFQTQHTWQLTLFAAVGFTLFSGLIPGAIFANLPRIVPYAAAVPLMVGLVFQGAGIGQVSGPILLSAAVELGGDWSKASYATGGLAITGLFLSCLLTKKQIDKQIDDS